MSIIFKVFYSIAWGENFNSIFILLLNVCIFNDYWWNKVINNNNNNNNNNIIIIIIIILKMPQSARVKMRLYRQNFLSTCLAVLLPCKL